MVLILRPRFVASLAENSWTFSRSSWSFLWVPYYTSIFQNGKHLSLVYVENGVREAVWRKCSEDVAQ